MSYADRDKYGMYKGSKDAGPGPALMGADTLIGDSVVNGTDEDLGDIKEIMIDMNNGQVAYAVLAFGGFLGMGEKLFAVPWQALHLDTVNKRFVLNVEKDRLKNAPGFNPDDWPDMSDVQWAMQIHTFYGTDPNRAGGPTMGPSVPMGGTIGGAGTGAGMGAGMGSSMGAGSAGSSGVGAGTAGTGAAGSSTTGGGSMGTGVGGSTSVGSDSGLDAGTRTGSGDLDSSTRGSGGGRGDNI
jgi:sporulation protein YlmC with PRC-barrel domain